MSQKFIQKYVDELYEIVNKSDDDHYKIYVFMVYLYGRKVLTKNYTEMTLVDSLADLILCVKLGNEHKDKQTANELLEFENDKDYKYMYAYDREHMKEDIKECHQTTQNLIEEYGRGRMLEQLEKLKIIKN